MHCVAMKMLFCLLFCVAAVIQSGTGLAADHVLQTREVKDGDCIRALLLENSCVRSMTEYSRLREAFGQANAGVAYSSQLVPKAKVSVPVSGKKVGPGCLTCTPQRIVRVEFENIAGAEKVRIYLDGPVLPDIFILKDPAPMRIVCDFDATLPQPGLSREISAAGRLIQNVRVGHQDKPFQRARVVLEIQSSQAGRIEQEFFEQESLFLITVHEASHP